MYDTLYMGVETPVHKLAKVKGGTRTKYETGDYLVLGPNGLGIALHTTYNIPAKSIVIARDTGAVRVYSDPTYGTDYTYWLVDVDTEQVLPECLALILPDALKSVIKPLRENDILNAQVVVPWIKKQASLIAHAVSRD